MMTRREFVKVSTAGAAAVALGSAAPLAAPGMPATGAMPADDDQGMDH